VAVLKELRERRLVQIVVAYAAAGWIALSAFDQLADRGVFSDFIYYLALIWYVVGFVVAVVVGWYHGEKGSQRVTRPEKALISLAVVAGLLTSWVVTNHRPQEGPIGITAGGAGDLAPSRIAVLYFADASRDHSLGYLADGLTEALIDELSAVPSLHVITRNGSLPFKGSDLPRDSIARVLQVGTVVTGTVEDAGDRVRMNVALSDGMTGVEFRRGTFEEAAADLFELRSQLGGQVATFLREWLGEEVDLRRSGEETDNVAAWALFQRGERARKEAEDLLLLADEAGALEAFLRADSLLARAEELDPEWPGPAVLRAEVALTLAQVFASGPGETQEYLDLGMEHVERALALNPRYAPGLERRGVLRYVKWRYGFEVDPVSAELLLESAEEDLRSATRIDPSRAYAWNILSMILSDEPDNVGAKLAALRAWEEDAFLRDATGLLWRLYATSYDLEQFADAIQYCNEGQRRFPGVSRFVECELWLLASRALVPDVERAWDLFAELEEVLPVTGAEYTRLKGKILVGAVLARAQLPDSAHALWADCEGNPEIDPPRDLLALQAVFRLQNGEEEKARDLVRTYLTLNPEHRSGWTWTSHWWWRGLQDNQEFLDILGAGTR